jgi:hypothetical protein
VSKVAQRYSLNANLLFTWRRREARSAAVGGEEPVKLLPVTVAAAGTSAAPAAASEPVGRMEIVLIGGGGKLSDGAGFSGLTESPAGVYLLSGTAATITSELDALVFTPNTFSATSAFTLTDTTSLSTGANDANTTVTVTNGALSGFLANQSSLDGTPGGFDILDTAANIAAKARCHARVYSGAT